MTPTTPTGQRLFYDGLPVDPPRVVSRVTPALNEILAIEREAAAAERERLRAKQAELFALMQAQPGSLAVLRMLDTLHRHVLALLADPEEADRA